MDKSILQQAHDILNERGEEKERRYGNIDDCMGRVSQLATILTGKEITVDDAYWILIALKLSRESHYHKADNMVDLCGYVQGLHSYREKTLPADEKLSEEELEKRMKVIGQNGNDGLHYDDDVYFEKPHTTLYPGDIEVTYDCVRKENCQEPNCKCK